MWNPTDGWLATSSYVEPVAIPDAHPGDEPRVCVSINKVWLPYVIGSLLQLVQPAAWATTDPTALATVLTDATELIESIATGGTCDVIEFRFTDACLLQYSTDGGTSWLDTPGWDTFSSACFTGPTGPTGPSGATGIVPPGNPLGVSTTDQACNIAAYLAADVIKASVQQVVTGITASETIFNTVAEVVDLIPGVDIVYGLVLSAGAILFNLVEAGTLSDYNTALANAGLWSAVQCAIYGAISPDGYVTDANYPVILTNLAAIPYSPSDVVDTIHDYVEGMGALGLEGVQNQGSLYVGDCSSCGEWCYTWDFTVSNGGWGHVGSAGPYGTWITTQGWTGTLSPDTVSQLVDISIVPPFSATATSMEVFFSTYSGGNSSHKSYTYVLVTGTNRIRYFEAASGTNQDLTESALDSPQNEYGIRIYTLGGAGSTPPVITAVTMRGTGTNPWGTDNCV